MSIFLSKEIVSSVEFRRVRPILTEHGDVFVSIHFGTSNIFRALTTVMRHGQWVQVFTGSCRVIMIAISVTSNFSSIQRQGFVIVPDQKPHLLRVSRFIFTNRGFPEFRRARGYGSTLYDRRWGWGSHDDDGSTFQIDEHRECEHRDY